MDRLLVSSNGRIQTHNGPKIGWTPPRIPNPNPEGYIYFMYAGKNISVHWAVCTAFHGKQPSPKHTVDHREKYDGDWKRERQDNRACNLRWATKRDQALNRKAPKRKRTAMPMLLRNLSWSLHSPSRRFESSEQIASILGCDASTVRGAAHKGHVLLKEWRAEYAPADESQSDLVDEEWVQVREWLRVSSMGRVQTHYARGGWSHRFTPAATAGKVYAKIGQNDYVHLLVAEAFLKDPPSPEHTQIDHIDMDHGNNCAANLRWATVSENLANREIKARKKM